MLDMAEEIVARGPVINVQPSPLVYDPTDGEELAEQERRRKRAEDLGDDQPQQPGRIGR